MSLKKFEAFVKVVDLGSLTRAAQALGYTQSGVSHMISALEEDFGFLLLKRNRSGVRLTAEGERVLSAIRGILNSNEQLTQIIASIHGLDTGVVRIGSFSSVAVHWLPGMIQSFQQIYPRIEFKLLNGDYHDVEHWLTEGAVDLGFVTLPTRLQLTCIPLWEDRLLAILPKQHRLAHLSKFPLSEVESEDFIGLLEDSNHDIRRIFDPAGLSPNMKFTTKDDYAIIAMVAHGLGISILPELLLKNSTGSNLRTMELEPSATRTIALALADPEHMGPAAQSFANHISTWLSAHADEKAHLS
ncbi:MAG: LysR substrate binding domain protein [Evtepia sp.]|jgi:DNA-binding transcriptional LysR family regulator|nr:LysR substrate binding domain protein [Evtepia sp.]